MNFFSRIIIFTIFCYALAACTSIKNISNPIQSESTKQSRIAKSDESNGSLKKSDEIVLYFVRPKSLLTLGQKVELYIDDKQVGTLGHDDKLYVSSNSGSHEFVTKVGWSIGLPVTGLGGACKFSENFKAVREKHFFKIKFSPGIFCGEHEIIEISETEYNGL